MPEPVLKLLHDSFRKAVEDEAVKAGMVRSFIPHYRSTADLTRQMAAQDKLFGDLVKKLKVKRSERPVATSLCSLASVRMPRSLLRGESAKATAP